MKRSSLLEGVREQVLKVPAYTLRAYEAEIKLNQNENPYDFPADLKDEILRRCRERSWSRYPEFVPDGLREQLARFAGWNREGILVGNGSNELLQASLMILVRDRISVAIPAPTFAVYSLISRVLGGRIVDIPLNADMTYNVDELVARSEEAGARLLIICTPNNPTGSVLEDAHLRRILDGFSGYVLLDEAYYEFCGLSGLKYLQKYPRLIITRTFSKAMGMAALRVGYLMAHPELVTQIAKAKLPYSVNQLSLIAAQVALDNLDRLRLSVEAILKERERLKVELEKVRGVRVYPTGANFFLFSVSSHPRAVFDYLYEHGVLVRDVSSYPMLSRCLRVSVGTPAEDDRFIATLRTELERVTNDE